MWSRLLPALVCFVPALLAQPSCPPTPTYSTCELVYELDASEAAAHRNPYSSVELHGEFQSPRHRTTLIEAYWDGGNRMVLRFAPNEAGEWEVRVTSNIARFNGNVLKVVASESEAPGFIKPANVHHWAYTESNKPHLWMGDTLYDAASMTKDAFQKSVDLRAQQKFTHIRGLALGSGAEALKTFANPNQPDPAFFRTLDERVRYSNQKGIIFDMILGGGGNELAKLFPDRQQRERYIRYMVARYAAFNITWQMVQDFESYANGRELTKEIGLLVKKIDPYQHPRSSYAKVTSSPLLADGWENFVTYQTADDEVGAIEHQLYPVPFVNAGIAAEGNADTLRHQLWNATMNGQYPVMGKDALDAASAKQMTAWFEFFADTRHWELEPYFDVDGGRAVALEGVEYVLYVEKPSGPVEVRVERHGYDVGWFNPITGEFTKLKNYKGEKFAAEPPDTKHDWVLFLSREGKKESMLRSYKFESRPILMQELESSVQKVPFEISEPGKDDISLSNAPRYQVKLKRETRGTREMMYLWTGDVVADGQGFRVVGTGPQGKMRLTDDMVQKFPAVFNLRLYGMNANGKVYLTDKILTLKP